MKQKELQRLIAARAIGEIYLKAHNPACEEIEWEVWVIDIDGGNVCSALGNQLFTERGPIRTYASIDKAYKVLRELGWEGDICLRV